MKKLIKFLEQKYHIFVKPNIKTHITWATNHHPYLQQKKLFCGYLKSTEQSALSVWSHNQLVASPLQTIGTCRDPTSSLHLKAVTTEGGIKTGTSQVISGSALWFQLSQHEQLWGYVLTLFSWPAWKLHLFRSCNSLASPCGRKAHRVKPHFQGVHFSTL